MTQESHDKYDVTFNQFQDANAERCQQKFHECDDWSECDWITAALGELGEAANLIKKRRCSKFKFDMIPPEKVIEELADAITYIDLLITKLGGNTGDAVVNKFNIVNRRVAHGTVTAPGPWTYSDLSNSKE